MGNGNNFFDQRPLIREWIEKNQRLANVLAAWLLFVAEMVVAKLLGDFDSPYYVEFPKTQAYYTLIETGVLASLSAINIYGVPAFIRWFQSDRRRPAVRLAVFGGLFSSFFCAPIIGALLGPACILFLTLTVVHAFGRLIKQAEG